MATLVLQTAGQAIGGMFAGPLGAMLGRAAGAIAGSVFDQALFGSRPRNVQGPRLKELHILGSSEGSPIARVFGRNRVAGQLIWATRFEEVVTTRKQKTGGKGSLASPKAKVTEYSYFANFAIGLCEGPVNRIGRVWADGKEVDISGFTWRLYHGDESQLPDSLIVAKQGDGSAPAYRGLAYIVFEQLPLERFGNRLPQLSFEVFKSLDDVEQKITAINIIPGASEFGYDTEVVRRDNGWGETLPVNTHTASGQSDWSTSIDQLQASCKNIATASLVVSWFADDLRCGQTKIQPGIENREKVTTPYAWKVAGLDRSSARLLSQIESRPAYGGTPSDESVLRALADLKERGIGTVFYPFIMMDIPHDTLLPDPYQAGSSQPAYPWRGKITCDPAPGQPASPDKTAAISAQVQAFFGTAQSSDFSTSGTQVTYSGPAEWGLRRMILHYAHLCALAGGVDAFLIASELKNLSILRDNNNTFPVVTALQALASDVAQILPDSKISYAADWSEYFGYQPDDGSADVYFHLDPLWMSPHVDFIGIDNYMPLSDWRDDPGHADAAAGVATIYDLDYLKSNIAGGEGYDWYYANDSDRQLQFRTPIDDGAHAKPWVFRYKDLKNWWLNPHYNRPGGIEETTPTAWLPQSKPFWFTEAGCPAIDNATNQPNVFHDPKSSESQLPHFSRGVRDDYIQRRYIDALVGHWAMPGDHNPVSDVYGGSMIEASKIYLWAWDARPFPAFPYRDDVWSDGANYENGHWINGRAGSVTLSSLIGEILQSYGFESYDATDIHGVIDGFVIDHTMSARQALEPLATTFSFDALETGGVLKFRHRDTLPVTAVAVSNMVETDKDKPLFTLKRKQETDLPNRLQLLFLDSASDYRQSVVEAQRQVGFSRRDLVVESPVAMSFASAGARAEINLHDIWSAREKLGFSLPVDKTALEPGDVFSFSAGGTPQEFRIEEIVDGLERTITATSLQRNDYILPTLARRNTGVSIPPVFGPPGFVVMDLPVAANGANPYASWIAATAKPWPGSLSLLENTGGGFSALQTLTSPATMGETLNNVPAGPLSRLDHATKITVLLVNGELQSVTQNQMLSGANLIALGTAQTGWEIIQFQNAELVGERTYELTRLLRGLAGSRSEMLAQRDAGQTLVLLDEAVEQVPTTSDDLLRARTLRLGPSGLDHGNASYVEFEHTPPGLGLRPYAPVHLAAIDNGSGVDISWVRRTRIDGDSWALNEVPLGEDSESFTAMIMDGGQAVRQIETTQPSFTYTHVQMQQDFGLPLPETLTLRVHQNSATFGAGAFEEKELNV